MAQDGLSTLSQPPQIDFSSTAGLQKGLTALQGQESTLSAERQKSLKPAIEKFETEMAKPKPDAPASPKSTEPPQAQLGKAGPEFFAAIAVFAGLASALSRRHATNALAAFSGGIQGLVQGNLLQFNQNYKTWKAETEAAQLDFQNRLDAYDAAINNRKLAADDLKNELLLASIRYDDKAMQDAKDDIFKMLNIRDRENETALRLKEVTARIDESYAKANEQTLEKLGVDLPTLGAFQQESRQQSGGDPQKYAQLLKQKLAPFSPSGSDPATLRAQGAMIKAGVPASIAVPGWGKDGTDKRTAAQAAAVQQIIDENPGMTPEQAGLQLAQAQVNYVAGKASVGQLTKMLGATRQAVDQLDFNIAQATKEMDRLGSVNLSPVINAVIRQEEKWTGDPAYSSLFFFMNGAATEAARLQSGGQASIQQLHEGAREAAQQWANINMTPASWKDVSHSMHIEGINRIQNFSDAIRAMQIGAAGSPAGVVPPSETPPAPSAPSGGGDGWTVEQVQ